MPRKARQMQHGDGESSRSYSLVPDVGGGGRRGSSNQQEVRGAQRLASAGRTWAMGGSLGEMAKVEEPWP